MTPAWAQRQEALLRDCIGSPDVFETIVDRLCDFVVPYVRRDSYFLCGNVLVIRSKYLPHTILLFDAFWQQFLPTIAALFCILYTLVGPWKQCHGEVPEKS